MAPLLRFSENKYQGVEKFRRKHNRTLHCTLKKALCHLQTALFLFFTIELHKIACYSFGYVLCQLSGGGCNSGIWDNFIIELSEFFNLLLRGENFKTNELVFNSLLKFLSHFFRIDNLSEPICLSLDQILKKTIIEITFLLL